MIVIYINFFFKFRKQFEINKRNMYTWNFFVCIFWSIRSTVSACLSRRPSIRLSRLGRTPFSPFPYTKLTYLLIPRSCDCECCMRLALILFAAFAAWLAFSISLLTFCLRFQKLHFDILIGIDNTLFVLNFGFC